MYLLSVFQCFFEDVVGIAAFGHGFHHTDANVIESPIELADEVELVRHHFGAREHTLNQPAVGLVKVGAHHFDPFAFLKRYGGEIGFKRPEPTVFQHIDDLPRERVGE